MSPFALETTGGHGASTTATTVSFLFAKQLRDSGLPADVRVGKLKKDISFALRRGTIAQVHMPLTAAPAERAVEDELLVLDRRTGKLGASDSLPSSCSSSVLARQAVVL